MTGPVGAGRIEKHGGDMTTKNDSGLWRTGMRCYVAGWYQSDCEYGGDPYRFDAGDIFATCPYCNRPVCWGKRLEIRELQQPVNPPIKPNIKMSIPVFKTIVGRFEQPKRKFADRDNVIMKEELLGANAWRLWCCGEPMDTDIVHLGGIDLDHIIPKGSDDIANRAPVCRIHNGRKSDRIMNYFELRREIAEANELYIQRNIRNTKHIPSEHDVEVFLHGLVNPEWAYYSHVNWHLNMV